MEAQRRQMTCSRSWWEVAELPVKSRPLDTGYGLVFLPWDSFRVESELGSKRLGWVSRDFNKCQLLSQAT